METVFDHGPAVALRYDTCERTFDQPLNAEAVGDGRSATMTSDAQSLRRELRHAGLTTGAIDAVWPEWWSEAAAGSPAADAELRYTLARRLGVSPRSLFEGPPRFVWRDRAKYKNLGDVSPDELGILSSFGVAVGRALLTAYPPEPSALPNSAAELRDAILANNHVVGMDGLLAACWALGIPVVQLRLFPLQRKRMHAMTAQVESRSVVLLGHENRFAAQAAYTVAHELGHVVLRHTAGHAALLDVEDPLVVADPDSEETEADRFALELLTGDPEPRVTSNFESFTATELAYAAMAAVDGGERVDPGVLALCLAHDTGRWRQGFGALKIIPPGEVNVGDLVNGIARGQMAIDHLPVGVGDYLAKVLGSPIVH